MRKPFVFEEFSFNDLSKYNEIFSEFGALVFKGLLRGERIFESYLSDLKTITRKYQEKHQIQSNHSDLSLSLTELAKAHRPSIGNIYDLGTRPGKLASENQLRYHPKVFSIVERIFGENALIAHPLGGDTLHIYPPGAENDRFYLPVHQDFPYLMQSPRQLTAWISLSDSENPAIGGLTLFLKSHKNGLRKCTETSTGLLEVVLDDGELDLYERFDCIGDVGDFVLIDTMLLHVSMKNTTIDKTRITQLYRYSDLASDDAFRYEWKSAQGVSPGANFADFYPELITSVK
jgi:ectoine hydroxylase-related dioxygenase (phytanoyl-CoA dioxygenase family)